MRPLNKPSILSASASIDSSEISTAFQIQCSVQAVATGTLAGNLKLQFSNDSVDPTNWSDITNATVSITGTPGVFSIQKTELCYNFVRVVFTKSGGTGTITVNYQSLGVN